jgi:ribosomal protein L11 methyltransferase
LLANEAALRARAGQGLAIVERPPWKRSNLEVVCRTRQEARSLVRSFGGNLVKIPGDWLQRVTRAQKRSPVRIGKRLLVTNERDSALRRSPRQGAAHLFIPAGAAFGTGEHATTALSLRLLEQVTRGMKPGWSMADLGTGSGILALAARRFGAGRVLAVDSDARAIATAKENARANRAGKIGFREADARHWRPLSRLDIVVANLFSDLLIQTLPNLRRYTSPGTRLILSGILRAQEHDVVRALYAHGIGILEVRRRGRWVAILAGRA